MSLVVDASVAGSWLMPDEMAAEATAIGWRVSDGTALVPDLFWHEMRNLLVKACRRKRLPEDELWLQLSHLERMPLVTVQGANSVHIVQLALRHSLTAYDASYLALALGEKLPLASFDRELRAAAVSEGIALLPDVM